MYICFRARCTFACERGKGRRREFFRNLSQTVKKTHVFLTSFLFSLSLSPPHLSTQVHVKAGKADEAGEALKVVKVPKAPKKAGKADEAGEALKAPKAKKAHGEAF